MARLIARSTFSLGMFSALAFWIRIRKRTLAVGSGPPDLTAISISLPILVKVRAMLPHRFSLRALRYSNARPMTVIFSLLSSTVVQNYDISPKKEKNRRQKTTACRQRLALRVHSRRRPVRMHAPTAPGCNPGSVRRRRPHAGGCRENGRRASRRSPPAACTSIHSPTSSGW